jgi:ABC-type hemin transport system ATPase subunit
MRLRFLHLPRCGPLVDVAVCFGQEGMLYGGPDAAPPKRRGAINFVVGVNGTGKSTLLRALFRSFRALGDGQPPPLPITLGWDRSTGEGDVTAVFHLDPADGERTFFAILSPVPDAWGAERWQGEIALLAAGAAGVDVQRIERGTDAWTGSFLQAYLPRVMLAYTTGDESLWTELEHPLLRPDWDTDSLGQADEADEPDPASPERPPGWSIEREWRDEVPRRRAQAVRGFEPSVPYRPPPGDAVNFEARSQPAERALSVSAKYAEGIRTRLRQQPARGDGRASRIRQADLRLAAVALAVWQAAREQDECDTEAKAAAFRRKCLDPKHIPDDPARRILSQIDWFQPTHLSLVYREPEDDVPGAPADALLGLLALAERVTPQALDRQRVVIHLGRRDFSGFREQFETDYPKLMGVGGTAEILDRIQDCRSGAEAVLRVFSDAKAEAGCARDALEPTLSDLFEGLRALRRAGLLEQVTLVIRRLRQVPASDGSLDDAIVTFDQLSDGEQMLLGRVALLHLVRGQSGALLLLDEPETHFNDIWKRELIDLIDAAILKTTAAQVVVSTHTSLALTDVFKSEIVLLRRDSETGRFYEADEPIETFGTTPGDILRDVFGADEIIGRRAAQILDLVLIVTALEHIAAPMWETGEVSPPELDTLWQNAQRVPHSFPDAQALKGFLLAMRAWTAEQLDRAQPPRIVDTLSAIEHKLGPGHYQFEFRRRILAHRRRDDAAPD